MFDVFYLDKPTGLFVHERRADSIEHACELSSTRYCWVITYLADLDHWDWIWEPPPWQSHQRHAWPSQHQMDSGVYLVPQQGYTDTNYHAFPKITVLPDLDRWHCPDSIDKEQFDWSWHPDLRDPPMRYQFGTQWQKNGGPWIDRGGSDIKHIPVPRAVKVTQDQNWQIPPDMDLDAFDWTWHPDATDPPYRYQFGTQHQKTGGPIYHVPGAVEVKYVRQVAVSTTGKSDNVILIDHMDGNLERCRKALNDKTIVASVRFVDSYLDTLRRALRQIPDDVEYVWVCSSVCDYGSFDFTWHPDAWQADLLHVFASDDQKFGDTFFFHAHTMIQHLEKTQILEWVPTNFVNRSATRWPIPHLVHGYATHADAIAKLDISAPLVVLSTDPIDIPFVPIVPLWSKKMCAITPMSTGSSHVVFPKRAGIDIRHELYDYAEIDRTHADMLTENALEIFFLSCGESVADDNWQHLLAVTAGKSLHVRRIDGVQGRIASQHAVAQAAQGHFYFVVPARLRVNENFNWWWQPDRLQASKHYIFYAHNPLIDLDYGHGALVAYNRNLVLDTHESGLDFTMSSPHQVITELSGNAMYGDDPQLIWRSAFREAVKLRNTLPDVENAFRLDKWVNSQNSWAQQGALAGIQYHDEVNGDLDELIKTYDWDWMNQAWSAYNAGSKTK
jgi:hypothetical protein